MKILGVSTLAIPDIKVIRFLRFRDHRGYFTEHFRESDFRDHPQMPFMKDVRFYQCNESRSRAGTVRGLHFQWSPYMGKLIRTVSGHMVDMILDIRKGSPSFGHIFAYDMPDDPDSETAEWIWVPPGFAHGNFFPSDTTIEYFCSGEYSPECEAGISPFAADLDWSLCDPGLKHRLDQTPPLMSEKDKNGHTLASWIENPHSGRFLYPEFNPES